MITIASYACIFICWDLLMTIFHRIARPLTIAAIVAGGGMLSACQTTQGAYTSDRPLHETAATAFIRGYMETPYPLIFAVAEDGHQYAYRYCTGPHCRDAVTAKHKALESCRSRSHGDCYVFANRKTIVAKKANGTAYTLDDVYDMTGSATVAKMLSVPKLCNMAFDPETGTWSSDKDDIGYVKEARKRGTKPSDCAAAAN